MEDGVTHGPAARGRLSGLRIFHSKSILYAAFVWARGALNSQNPRVPAWADADEADSTARLCGVVHWMLHVLDERLHAAVGETHGALS